MKTKKNMNKKGLAIFGLLLFLSLVLIDVAFATHENDGDHTTIGKWIDYEITYANEIVFVIDGFPVIVNNPHVTEIILDWDNPGLPEGEIFLDGVVDGILGMQIPKNMPRTMNLDFGSSLFPLHSPDLITELESECFYILEIPLGTDHVSFVSSSLATGRWEPVIKDNDSCHNIYRDLLGLKVQGNSFAEEILILLEDKVKKVYYTGENIISVVADPEAASVIFETDENAKLDVKVPKVYKVGPYPFILRNGEEVDAVIDSDECFFYATIETQEPEKTEIIFAFWPEYPGTVENCETFVVSPLKQIKLGVEPDEVVCNDGLTLLLKPTESKPVCVTGGTAKKLLDRDWRLVVSRGSENEN